jgi:alpha-tubulin suppressor-like RCC1 family protein
MTLPGEQVIDACGGWDHSCALTQSGSVYCWGAANLGLGGIAGNEHLPEKKATGLMIKGVTCGDFNTCAWSDSTLSCWGKNTYGQLGTNDRSDRLMPTQVTGLAGAKHAGITGEYACAVTTSGGVSCWGSPWSGRLGNGRSGNESTSAFLVTALP